MLNASEPHVESTARFEGGDALVRALARRGVAHVFSVSGGPINSAYHATTRAPVEIVHCRHEAAAAFMADAVYRSTGRPGVALVTLGPGVTNTITPMACAAASGVPLMVVGAQTSTAQRHRGAGMEIDTLPIARQVVKWAVQVPRADRIDELIDEAWRRMSAATPGPVYVEIPADVLGAPVDPTAHAEPLATSRPTADPAAVEAVVADLRGRRRVLVIVGDGVVHASDAEPVRAMVDALQPAVTTLRLGRGAVDERRTPTWIGPGYVPANPVLATALATADAVVLLGHHWEFDLEFGAGVNPDALVVQVHEDGAMLGRNGPVHRAVAGAPAAVAAALTDRAAPFDAEWAGALARQWTAEQGRLGQMQVPGDRPHPLLAIDAALDACTDDTVVVTSHGNVDFWADARCRVSRPRQYLRVGQSGALGAELPFAVGAAIARPDDAVVAFVGDGGVGFHITEIETAVRMDARVVIVVLDDHSWGAISMPQQDGYGVAVAMDLPPRDWAAAARALGARGCSVTVDQLNDAVREALTARGPTLLQVAVASELSPYMRHISPASAHRTT